MENENTNIIPQPNAEIVNRVWWEEKRDELLNRSAGILAVDSEETLETAAGVQKSIRKHIKELSKLRLEVTRPLDEAKKKIMAQEKELIAELNKEFIRVKGLNDSYATQFAQEAEAERQRLMAEEAERQKVQQSQAASIFGEGAIIDDQDTPIELPPEKPKAFGSRVVKRWSFDIRDPRAVPREFCTPDPVKIRAFMNSQVKLDMTPEIKGVHFTSTQSVEG